MPRKLLVIEYEAIPGEVVDDKAVESYAGYMLTASFEAHFPVRNVEAYVTEA